MHRLEPVIWTKGTFLNPQHLQSQDRFLEETLQFQLQALQFRPWGFQRLRLDQTALAAGTLAISEAAGILPDGLLFEIPQSDPAPPVKPLADHFDADVQSVDVYLAVPNYRDRGFNVASKRRDVETRYRAEVEMVRDENTGQAEKPVMVGRKNLRLLVETENREGSSTLRVARVRKTTASLFQLDPRFIPPLVNFETSDYLVSIARRLVEMLSAKSSELAGSRREKDKSLADFTSSDIPRFWLLYTVNAAMPVFRHLFETRKGHPEALYAAMLSLAGALTTFSATIHPRDLPPYNHDELGACFTDLDEKLRLLLDTVLKSNYVSLPLRLTQPSIYTTSLDNESYLANTKMYLAVSADIGKADLITRAPQLIKICSADAIEHLVQRALPGLALTYVSTPPGAIQVKLNYLYFGVSQSGGSWETIVRARNLAAYVPGEIPNPKMELVILLPQSD
jgi:type VI secretion system protein ImpJ